ncbi:hypothetical protein DFH27DRAFT_655066 [Peziza echinospora]|nr:hypothetical protein DFH27DRAFT_655066 [Peziza echinospora]
MCMLYATSQNTDTSRFLLEAAGSILYFNSIVEYSHTQLNRPFLCICKGFIRIPWPVGVEMLRCALNAAVWLEKGRRYIPMPFNCTGGHRRRLYALQGLEAVLVDTEKVVGSWDYVVGLPLSLREALRYRLEGVMRVKSDGELEEEE